MVICVSHVAAISNVSILNQVFQSLYHTTICPHRDVIPTTAHAVAYIMLQASVANAGVDAVHVKKGTHVGTTSCADHLTSDAESLVFQANSLHPNWYKNFAFGALGSA